MRTDDKVAGIEDGPLTCKSPFKCVSIPVSMKETAAKRGGETLLRLRPYEIDVSSDVLLKATDRYCHLTKKSNELNSGLALREDSWAKTIDLSLDIVWRL